MTVIGDGDMDRDIWNEEAWAKKRSEAGNLRSWYDGDPLEKKEPARTSDGSAMEDFPLHLNIHELECDLHKDLARGMPTNDDTPFVKAVIERGDSERSEALEVALNQKIWKASHGGPIQQEGLLNMNIYGGCVYKIEWAPWESFDLPLGLAVRHIPDPSLFYPKAVDYLNPWRILECYFGYELSPAVARLKYGVDTNKKEYDKCLYMEHWTSTEWSIQIDDQPAVITYEDEEIKLKGENTYGFVPFYYIPHKRSTGYYGDSQVSGKESFSKELNARAIGTADIAKQTYAGIVYTTDVQGPLKMDTVMMDGKKVFLRVDLGSTKGFSAGAKPPTIGAIPVSDVPEFAGNYYWDLIDLWQVFARISPATLGRDDTQSGRITGPAVGQRMFSGVSHATTERDYYSTGKTIIDRDLLKILANEGTREKMKKYGFEVPDITPEDLRLDISQTWPPMIPLERAEQHRETVERYREGLIGPKTALKDYGISDTEGELKDIDEHQEKKAERAAQARPFFGSDQGGNDT